MRIVNSKQYIVNSWGLRFFIFVFSLFTVYYLLSTTTLAQTEYELLAPIPLSGADSAPSDKTTAEPYIKGVFMLIIAVAGGLAVVKIIFGGIQNAIWGLLLAISAWLILFTINPDLIKFDLTIPPPREVLTPPT